jgi:hypothetical protein
VTDDVRIAASLPGHHKTKKLRKRLKVAGCWSLVCLFLWSGVNRWDGSLAGMSDEDIELAADWRGAPGAFVAALVEVRFLDGPEHARSIHDWTEHNPYACMKGKRIAKAKAGAMARWGARENAPSMPRAKAKHATRRIKQCPPTPTQPIPNQEEEHASRPEGAQPVALIPCASGDDFPLTEAHAAEFRTAYPAIDLAGELRAIRAWSISNPSKRKTHGGMLRFVNAWLAKAQNTPARASPVFAKNDRMSGVNALEELKRGLVANRTADGVSEAAPAAATQLTIVR